MIEIKLLKDKRYKIKNEEALIIQGEQNATEVTVEFPAELKELHKRVDFVNSDGKDWTIGLYTPETISYSNSFDKLNFVFNLPSEIAINGELKMQFVAYKPDKNQADKITVIFELIVLWISEGITRCKKNAEPNFDLLVEMAELCKDAEALNKQAERNTSLAIKSAKSAKEKSDKAIKIAEHACKNALSVVERANNGEFIGEKGDKGDKGDSGKDGATFTVGSLIGLSVDESGNFYAYADAGAEIDFRYDENTGELYLIYK